MRSQDVVAAGEVERNAGEGGSHLEAGEARCAGGGFAGFKNSGADAAPRQIGMNEEGADFRRVDGGIEKLHFRGPGRGRCRRASCDSSSRRSRR